MDCSIAHSALLRPATPCYARRYFLFLKFFSSSSYSSSFLPTFKEDDRGGNISSPPKTQSSRCFCCRCFFPLLLLLPLPHLLLLFLLLSLPLFLLKTLLVLLWDILLGRRGYPFFPLVTISFQSPMPLGNLSDFSSSTAAFVAAVVGRGYGTP